MRLTRRERIKMLLRTYVDAVSPGRNPSDVRGTFGSKPPARTELWQQGSYHELGQALDRLRQPCPKIYKHTVAFYIESEPWARKSTAEKGLMLISAHMPHNVFVPEDISIRFGFLPSEAKYACKPHHRSAA